MDEQRLPFPVHGTRLEGEGAPAHMGEAARLLYLANLLADTAGVPIFALRSPVDGGMAEASVHGPLAFKRVAREEDPEPEPEPEKPATPMGRLVWLPEGFVFTPRTPGAPSGYGMPPTPDGRGTPGGPLRQVMVNRFAGNQYPDVVYRIANGDRPGRTTTASLFFMPWELATGELRIGVPLGAGPDAVFLPQFSKRWAPLYREPDSGAWHCHRPQHHLDETSAEATLRRETNLVRELAGKPPLAPPLRGTTGELSQAVAYQIRFSGVVDHDSPTFREGHRTFSDRRGKRSGFAHDAGENLNLEYPALLDDAAAMRAVDAWSTSPGHLANMVADWAEEGEKHAWIDPCITLGGAATPDTPGALSVQIFRGAADWVKAHPGVHGERAPVSVPGDGDMFRSVYPSGTTTETHRPYVGYLGRAIRLTEDAVSAQDWVVLSATTLVEAGAVTKIRVAVLRRPGAPAGLVSVVVYEGAAHDFLATRAEAERFDLPSATANFVSRPLWSASGSKAVFSYTTLVQAPVGLIDGSYVEQAEQSAVVGQNLHFVELRAGESFVLYTSRLDVTPLAFGKAGGTAAAWHSQECNGTCRFIAHYQGEAVVYVTLTVQSASNQTKVVFEKTFKAWLEFPGGQQLVYADIRSAPGPFAGSVALLGFVRHLLPFDATDPDGIAYLQYDLPESNAHYLTGRLMIRGTEVKYSQDPTRRGLGMYGMSTVSLSSTRDITTLSAHRGVTDAVSFLTSIRLGGPPSKAYPTVLVSHGGETAPRMMPGGPGWYGTGIGLAEYVLVGPTILADGPYDAEERYQRIERFEFATYKGDWLYAGRIETSLGGIGTRQEYNGTAMVTVDVGAWQGEDQYYRHSSLDLPALTGMPDLKQNILPIGVL